MVQNKISIVTWNVRGISSQMEKEELVDYCKRYNIHITAIQETEVVTNEEITLQSRYKMVLLEQKTAQ